MILSKTVKMLIHSSNYDYWLPILFPLQKTASTYQESKTPHLFDLPRYRIGIEVTVKVKDLPIHSNKLVSYQCDKCRIISERMYFQIMNSKPFKRNGQTLCRECTKIYRKQINKPVPTVEDLISLIFASRKKEPLPTMEPKKEPSPNKILSDKKERVELVEKMLHIAFDLK